MNATSPSRLLVSEFVGTAMLLVAIVGSGIMGSRLFGAADGGALLVNALATGAALAALIAAFSSWSTHFNPAVSLVIMLPDAKARSRLPVWMSAQIAGASFGVILANVMFGEDPVTASARDRAGWGLLVGEAVATFGLVVVIRGTARWRAAAVPGMVGAYVASGIWFTSSTAFANPAVTVSRMLTDTYCGIRPADVPGFIVAQLVGAALARWLMAWLSKEDSAS